MNKGYFRETKRPICRHADKKTTQYKEFTFYQATRGKIRKLKKLQVGHKKIDWRGAQKLYVGDSILARGFYL